VGYVHLDALAADPQGQLEPLHAVAGFLLFKLQMVSV